MNNTIGVLALQGGFAKHIDVLRSLGSPVREVRTETDLAECDGLIIPGGESTVLTRLLMQPGTGYGTDSLWKPAKLFDTMIDFSRSHPVMGTCAGLIMLARPCGDARVVSLDRIPVSVDRNAYGRQTESFIRHVALDFEDGNHGSKSSANSSTARAPYPAVFIRAPRITSVGNGVEVLAKTRETDGSENPVMVKIGNIIGLTFHPELVPNDTRIHAFFLSLFTQ